MGLRLLRLVDQTESQSLARQGQQEKDCFDDEEAGFWKYYMCFHRHLFRRRQVYEGVASVSEVNVLQGCGKAESHRRRSCRQRKPEADTFGFRSMQFRTTMIYSLGGCFPFL